MKNEEIITAPSAEEEEQKDKPEEAPAPSQDPVAKERERIEKKQFTRIERLEFEKRKIEEQLQEEYKKEGKAPATPKDTLVTVEMLEKMQKDQARKTALELADAIEDENERTVVKHYLDTRVVPSGNPQEDLKFARAAVNSLRNAQIAEETARKTNGKSHPSGSGVPARPQEDVVEFTAEELVFLGPPYNLTKDQVIASRPKA